MLPGRAGWSAGVGWLTGLSVAAALAINAAGIVGIAVARRGLLEEAARSLRLQTAARVSRIGGRLASAQADLAFLAGSPTFFGLAEALASRDPQTARWRRLEAQGALLLLLRGHPELSHLTARAADGTPLVEAARRGGVPVLWVAAPRGPAEASRRGEVDAVRRPVTRRFGLAAGTRGPGARATTLEATLDAARLFAADPADDPASAVCSLSDPRAAGPLRHHARLAGVPRLPARAGQHTPGAGPAPGRPRRARQHVDAGAGLPEPAAQRLRGAARRRRGAGFGAAGGGPRRRGDRRSGSRRAGLRDGPHLRAVLLHQALDRPWPVDLLRHRPPAPRRAERGGQAGGRRRLPDRVPRGAPRCLRRVRRAAGCSWSRTRPTCAPPSRSCCAPAASTWRPSAASRRRSTRSRAPPVDVVLTDLRMPGADGLDLVRRIRNLDPGLPVLVVTGHGTIASAVECIKAGAADYILKPMNVLRIEIPPLRERREDIPGLAAAFTREIAARLGRRPPAIAPAVMADLQAYAWPGNVRELRNVIERALILNRTDPLDSLDLPPVQGLAATARPAAAAGPDLNLRGALARRERDLLIEALRRSGGVRKEAARMLGIDQRNLGYYLHKHGIDPDDLPDPRR